MVFPVRPCETRRASVGHTPRAAATGGFRVFSSGAGLPEDAVHEHPLHLLPGPAIAIAHRAVPQLEGVESRRLEEGPRRLDREEPRYGPLPPDEDRIADVDAVDTVVVFVVVAIARRGWLESKHGHVVDLDEIPRGRDKERESWGVGAEEGGGVRRGNTTYVGKKRGGEGGRSHGRYRRMKDRRPYANLRP
jgi:hypothetical protein